MSKSRSLDPIIVGIVAATLVAIVFMLTQASGSSKTAKIAILDTNPLVEAFNAGQGDTDLLAMRERIEMKTQALVEEGYVVLRAEMVRSAPRELYVQVGE